MANLLSQTVPRGLRLVHLSVDLVFSGLRDGGYVEDDPIDPVTVYGKTMAEGEQLLRESDPAACILRISLPMGVSFNGHAGAIDWITSRFRKSRPATLYFDEIRTPTYTDCMNRLYESAAGQRPERRFSCRRAAAIDPLPDRPDHQSRRRLRSGLLQGIPRREAGPIPPRAGNVSMDSGKLIARLGYNPFDPWPLDEQLVPTDPRWHYDRARGRARLGGASLSASCASTRPAATASPSGPPGGGSIVSSRHCPPHATRKRVPDRYGVKEFLKRGKSPQIY